jgi:hypothetical protein
MSNYTLDYLAEAGLKPTMGYLLPRIAARSNITYGEIAERLERDLNISGKIFPTHIGHVAGPLQNRLFKVDPRAPLLNALIVRADNDEAGTGIDGYLKRRYRIPKHQDLDPDHKSALLQKAAEDVYAFNGWGEIYRKAFKATPPPMDPAIDVQGTERDGQTRGGPAESEEHRVLKSHVLAHPGLVGATGRLVTKCDEYRLLSGDEVDVFFAKRGEFWLVEVKSERSNDKDLLRGCYQAIKYRAVYKAQIGRTLPDARVNVVLVTRMPLSAAAKAIVRDYDIRHVLVKAL